MQDVNDFSQLCKFFLSNCLSLWQIHWWSSSYHLVFQIPSHIAVSICGQTSPWLAYDGYSHELKIILPTWTGEDSSPNRLDVHWQPWKDTAKVFSWIVLPLPHPRKIWQETWSHQGRALRTYHSRVVYKFCVKIALSTSEIAQIQISATNLDSATSKTFLAIPENLKFSKSHEQSFMYFLP